jgi:hypothetical protein
LDVVDLPLPARAAPAAVERALEAACPAHGLRLVRQGTLKTYPGSTHWHFKLGQARGTLEITYWPQQRRAWFKVAAGRRAAWIESAIARLGRATRARLRG